jgi:hypothetical protein
VFHNNLMLHFFCPVFRLLQQSIFLVLNFLKGLSKRRVNGYHFSVNIVSKLGITLYTLPFIQRVRVGRGKGSAVPLCPSLLPDGHFDHVGRILISPVQPAPSIVKGSSLDP